MATYRCPECGAAHKEQVGQCRLCGAPLDTAITTRNVAVDPTVAASRFKSRSLNHFIFIGVGIAVVVIIGSFALGIVESSTLETWKNRLPWVDPVNDPSFAWSDPNERIIVTVPKTPISTEEEDDKVDPIDLGAESTSWTTRVGDTTYVFGYTTGLDFDPPTDSEGSETLELLRGAFDDIAETQGGIVLNRGDVFSHQGGSAMDGTIDRLALPEGVAFGSARVILADGELYFVETVDYSANNDLHHDIRSSFIIVSQNPDVTIPEPPTTLGAG